MECFTGSVRFYDVTYLYIDILLYFVHYYVHLDV